MVPIVEPEVLMDGKHNIKKCYDVTSKVLEETVKQLRIAGIDFSGMVLKPNMILNGKESGIKNNKNEVADFTLKCIQNNLPTETPGVAEVNIVKNRSGQTGKVDLFFSKEFTQFSNYSKQDQQ